MAAAVRGAGFLGYPYTLHNWEVPQASGGSLSITSAPTLATIDVSWGVLAAGTRYLGTVAHTGLMGLTLIDGVTP